MSATPNIKDKRVNFIINQSVLRVVSYELMLDGKFYNLQEERNGEGTFLGRSVRDSQRKIINDEKLIDNLLELIEINS